MDRKFPRDSARELMAEPSADRGTDSRLRKRKEREPAQPADGAPLPALRHSQLDRYLEVYVECLQASVRGLGVMDYEDLQVLRKLTIHSSTTAADLARAIMCVFGLETIDLARSRFGKGAMMSHGGSGGRVAVAIFDDVDGGIRSIRGLERRDKSVFLTAQSLKRTRLAQLLDRPLVSSPARSSTEGQRTTVAVLLRIPARSRALHADGSATTALRSASEADRELQRLQCNVWWMARACERLCGAPMPPELEQHILEDAHAEAALTPATLYNFRVSLFAVGTDSDVLDEDMHTIPVRLTDGHGECYSGNMIDHTRTALTDAINWRFAGETSRFGVLDPIWNWARVPIYRVVRRDEGDEGEPGASPCDRLCRLVSNRQIAVEYTQACLAEGEGMDLSMLWAALRCNSTPALALFSCRREMLRTCPVLRIHAVRSARAAVAFVAAGFDRAAAVEAWEAWNSGRFAEWVVCTDLYRSSQH